MAPWGLSFIGNQFKRRGSGSRPSSPPDMPDPGWGGGPKALDFPDAPLGHGVWSHSKFWSVWTKSGDFMIPLKNRLPGGYAVMGYHGPLLCHRMNLVPQTKSLLPHRVKALVSVQEKAPMCKGKRQLLNLAPAKELCDLRLDTLPL